MSGWWITAFVAQWILLVALAAVVVALARQVGTLHLRLGPLGALELDVEGPPLGEVLQPQTVQARDGGRLTLGGSNDSGRIAMFVSPDCPVCSQVLAGLPTAARSEELVPQVISDAEAERRLGIPGTPYVLVLDDVGVTRAKGTVNNLEQLEGLVDTAMRRTADPAAHIEAM